MCLAKTQANLAHTVYNVHPKTHMDNTWFIVTFLVLPFWGGVIRRIGGPMRSVVSVHIVFIIWTQNKNNENETVLNGEIQNTEQKIITHETQVKKGYLSMILNQRQLTTPASDWEPYQAKRKSHHRKTNIDNPPNSRPDHTKTKHNKRTKVRTWQLRCGCCFKFQQQNVNYTNLDYCVVNNSDK